MTEITLEAVQAKQAELAEMIAKLTAGAIACTLRVIPEATIELRPGEQYGGVVLDENGAFSHNLVLMPEKAPKYLNYDDGMAWAEGVGGTLPTPQEQALLFANCRQHMEPVWHWSCKTSESDASYAWGCYFDYGYQGSNRKSYEGCVRAVRRA